MKNRKGISLIVLVITIIVMIILSSAVIITLSNTNIIAKAKEAVEKTNTVNEKYLSEIKLAERKIEKAQGASWIKDTEGGSVSSVNINTLTEISLNQMKSQSFVDTLNANIGTNTNWVKWKLGSNGYPVLDM